MADLLLLVGVWVSVITGIVMIGRASHDWEKESRQGGRRVVGE